MVQKIWVLLIGAGQVGSEFLSQLHHFNQRSAHFPNKFIIEVVAIAKSSKLLLSTDYTPIDLTHWKARLERDGKSGDLSVDNLLDFLKLAPNPTILVDCTSSLELARLYPQFIRHSIHLATPNKKAFSSELSLWREIQRAQREKGMLVKHEATVGAGLPILSTLQDLLDTGDSIKRIEGVFSGTLAHIFNSFCAGSESFSSILLDAKEKGYTEPDPRDDLSGMDVARKLIILARLCGLQIEENSFPIQSLIPAPLKDATKEEYLLSVSAYDGEWQKLKDEASSRGNVLRFVGVIDVTTAKLEVALKEFNTSHSLGALQGSSNSISFYTERYPNPLVIQGAGAGGAVTAMGVLSDVIHLCRQI